MSLLSFALGHHGFRLLGRGYVLVHASSMSGSSTDMPPSKLMREEIFAPCTQMMHVSEVYLLSQVSTAMHATTLIWLTEMNVYRRQWIAAGTRFLNNRERGFLRWVCQCWAQFAMPMTNDYEFGVPDRSGYRNRIEWYNEKIRRQNSVAMVNESLAELGARIIHSPRMVYGPDRFPDEVDPDMPALVPAPENQPLMPYSEWLLHLW